MHYLLIARFTMDDIPLRLYGSYDGATAEADAKAIHADPTRLDTKWARSMDKWPLPARGDFVGTIVLSINELDGYPSKVRFDSTAEPVPAPPEPAPPTTTPPDPAHPPVPEGHIEITDPEHRLRSGIDYALDLADPKDGWSKVEKATVGDNSHKFRFCCPEEYHPSRKLAFLVLSPSGLPDGFVEITDPRHNVRVGIDYYADRSVEKGVLWKLVQESSGNLSGFRFACPAEHFPWREPAPAPSEPSGLSRATDNDTPLASGARSLDAENADLKRRVAELEAENSIMAAKNAELHATHRLVRVAYIKKNDELRALNEDLNHRLSATKARADRATDLEGNLRGTAQHLLSHFQRLEERAKWAFRFADEEMMPLPYARAMLHCQRKFAEEFQGFLHTYPHVLPDIPEEYHPIDDTDDEMND